MSHKQHRAAAVSAARSFTRHGGGVLPLDKLAGWNAPSLKRLVGCEHAVSTIVLARSAEGVAP